MKLKDEFDIKKLMQTIGTCEGEVYFVTTEDRINLQSMLSRYVFCMIIQNQKVAREGEIRCQNPDDYRKLQPFARVE